MAIDVSRSQKRSGFPMPTRVQLLENDIDEHESEDTMFHSRMEKKLDTLNSRLLGVMSGLVVASVMLAVNAVVK